MKEADTYTKAAPTAIVNAATDEQGVEALPNERCKGTKNIPNTQAFDELFADNLADTTEAELPQMEDAQTPTPAADDTLPIWGLPAAVQSIIKEYTDVFQCPSEFVTGAVLVAAGTAAGTAAHSFDGKYLNTPCLWLCNIAASGSNKSVPVREIMKPLQEKDAESFTAYQAEVQAWKVEMEAAKKKPKKGEANQPQQLLPKMPVCKQLHVDDTTAEARIKLLYNNPHGVVQYTDELRGFFDNIGRYNAGGELSQMLTIYDNGAVTINRKTDDEPVMRVNEPFMAIIGSIQPDILQTTFNEQMRSNGLLFRFSFCYPATAKLPPYNGKTLRNETKKAWRDILERIYNAEPKLYTFDMYGANELEKFVNANRERINGCAEDDGFTRSVLAKQTQQMERVALITAILHNADHISGEHVKYAAECVAYFERCMDLVRAKFTPQTQGKAEPTKTEVIRWISKLWPDFNRQKFGEAVGCSKDYAHKMLADAKKKEERTAYALPQPQQNTGDAARTLPYADAAPEPLPEFPTESTDVRLPF